MTEQEGTIVRIRGDRSFGFIEPPGSIVVRDTCEQPRVVRVTQSKRGTK